MSAQPVGPVPGEHEVIHLGGQSAVVVPEADYARLRTAAEDASRVEELLDALEERGRTGELSEADARRILRAPTPGSARAGVSIEEVRRRLGLAR